MEREPAVSRLLILVEGQTEEDFVNYVLAHHLSGSGVFARAAMIKARGSGIGNWEGALNRIIKLLKQDSGQIVSTMVDYYGMPPNWPRRDTTPPSGSTPPQIAEPIERAMLDAVARELRGDFNPSRFVPYVMMHEFEAMLFSDCAAFGDGIGRCDLTGKFQSIRDEFDTPEAIDDSPDNAPSKRIKKLMCGYQKRLMGPPATQRIGLAAIREACPHFGDWLARLERLA